MELEPGTPTDVASLLAPFLRASSLHISGAAATASLRKDLVADHRLRSQDVDAAFAVSRLTPGTNLLALYTLLGHKVGGWPLAVSAVAVGVGLPALIVVMLVFLYTHATSDVVSRMMTGARAAGVAVLLGSAVQLLKPHFGERPVAAATLALVAGALAATQLLNLFVVLVLAAVAGALVLKPR
jgi:chromate transport protein ChrA